MASAGSRRARKRHVQQELFKNGGKRKGAGRKPKNGRSGTPHCERPEIRLRHPLHVVLRVVADVGTLRRRKMYQAVREATIVAAVRERIRIVQISLQRNHIHLLVEAESKLGEDQQGLAQTWLVDPFSSGVSFPDWQELEGRDFMWPIRETYDPLLVRRPQSWLLREGWKAHGPISARDVPSRGTAS